MKQSVLDLQDQVQSLLGDHVVASEVALNELTIELKPETALADFIALRDQLGFDQLMD